MIDLSYTPLAVCSSKTVTHFLSVKKKVSKKREGTERWEMQLQMEWGLGLFFNSIYIMITLENQEKIPLRERAGGQCLVQPPHLYFSLIIGYFAWQLLITFQVGNFLTHFWDLVNSVYVGFWNNLLKSLYLLDHVISAPVSSLLTQSSEPQTRQLQQPSGLCYLNELLLLPS